MDLAMIAHYLQRGHSLDELLGLSASERLFFHASAELELEALGGALK